jgi:hypothetical protein
MAEPLLPSGVVCKTACVTVPCVDFDVYERKLWAGRVSD